MINSVIHYRHPNAEDGLAVHQLVSQCPPLDQNSVYCNLLQCSDFAQTSMAACNEQGQIIGFVSGYQPPQRPDTLFIWQVALHPDYRGAGIARTLLATLFDRVPATCLETTISPGNTASEKLFNGFFQDRQMQVERSVLFAKDQHFNHQHPDEWLYRAQPQGQTT